ncbi:hypothetical protein CTAYLR_001775 [Chrysophaeum taylorii]|uniref:Uncharacterized protein n=1 Tax=Chrysophaeum taylorii TaxID=2483200 RepID=A0AAD7XMH1_9STRA|nr:hypothetical protein CTAYLR_001775 [Chrysophaeum taylorii]
MTEEDWEARAIAAEEECSRLRLKVRELESELDVLACADDGYEPLRIHGLAKTLAPEPYGVIEGACGGANCLAVALLSASSFVVSGADGSVRWFEDGVEKSRQTVSSPAIALRKRPKSDEIFASTMDGSTYVLAESSPSVRHKDHEKLAVDCDWSPDGRLMASAARDKSVALYANGVKERTFVLPNSPECVRFVDDRTLVVAARQEPFLRYVDVETMKETRCSLNASAWDAHVSFDVLNAAVRGDYIAVATSTHRHIVYKVRQNKHVRVLTGHASDEYANTRIAWLGGGGGNDDDSLVSSSAATDPSLYQWDFSSGKLLTKVERAHGQGGVRNLDALSGGGEIINRLLATTSFDKTVKLWHLGTTTTG